MTIRCRIFGHDKLARSPNTNRAHVWGYSCRRYSCNWSVWIQGPFLRNPDDVAEVEALAKQHADYVKAMNYEARRDQGVPLHLPHRDWLAGLAMQGFVSDPQTLIGIRDTAQQAGIEPPAMMALTSYKLADAMIAEGDKPQPTEE